MKKFALVILILLSFTASYAKEQNLKFILLISEQNIAGRQRAWWVNEVDFSVTETVIARRLTEQGCEVLRPSNLNKLIRQRLAFRKAALSEAGAVRLANLSKADYVVLGEAIASKGEKIPQSNMRSYAANITAELIRVKDGRVIAYLDAIGKSAYIDALSGGKEALSRAGEDLAQKIIYIFGN